MPFEQTFHNITADFLKAQDEEFESCVFLQCDFSNATLSKIKFTDCEFKSCNLSNAVIHATSFQCVFFHDCKLMGIHFENANPFGLELRFLECVLDHSSFYKMSLAKLELISCRLRGVDFSESKLPQANFSKSDVAEAVFSDTNLEKVDFTQAENFSIDPRKNNIKGAKFSTHNLHGLLHSFQIHIQ